MNATQLERPIRYMTHEQLVKLNTLAARRGGKSIAPAVIDTLAPDDLYPISFTILHGADDVIRATVILGNTHNPEMKTVPALLDMRLSEYRSLPVYVPTEAAGDEV